MSHEETREELDGIAVIGMAVRVPGARNLETFWHNLRNGVESVATFTDEELLASGFSLETIRNPDFVRAKGILEAPEMFDAAFFGISPREAELMDPQHRLLMECAWEGLEHAGYNSETYDGRIAVFTSAGLNTYFPFNIVSNPGLAEQVGGFQLSIYSDKDFVPTRIAYSMNLKGPGVDIGTACSSSLVSVHFACQSLITYQTDMALVGAITVHFPQKVGHLYEEGMAYSPDGHCRPFDASPSGLIDGNGMGAVVLKRLEDALADGDSIYAVIKGTAINNDGSVKVGYSAPSVSGQAEVITEAQAIAGFHPETVTYVEAHGTATPLGDPIEIAALTQAFRAGTNKTGFCGIGSVKSNIGHIDKAAGLAGLIKTVLALKNGMLPPSLHFKAPNPKLNLSESPFYVVDRLVPWPSDGHHPRRAGISSFGVGGTNAHAVLEEAPLAPVSSPSRPLQLLMVSAKTEIALAEAMANLAAFLEREPETHLADVSYTLQVGRRAFTHRRAMACSSVEEAETKLSAPLQSQPAVDERADRDLVFMFPGQGAQYPGMGRELYLRERVFQEQVDQCARYLEPSLGLDIRNVLFPQEKDREAAAEQLAQTALTQPALFTIEYALAQLWMHWGLRPSGMIGHSIGEYVAACLAGVFSLQDALALVAARGHMMQQLPSGDMLAVPLSEKALRPLLDDAIDLAAVNGPELCVVSGSESAVAEFRHRLENQGLSGRPLHTSHAFHSAMMAPILEAFIEQVRRIELKPPEIPYLSNLTGDWITAAEATQPSYWAEHLRHTVRFAAGLERLFDRTSPLLLEVGPGRTLSSLASQARLDSPPLAFASLPQAREHRGAQDVVLHTLADLWSAGVTVDWSGFYGDERRLRLALPTYPFQRRRYWVEPGKPAVAAATKSEWVQKNTDMADWFYLPSWKRTLTPASQTAAAPSDISWLVFADDHAFGTALEAALGQPVAKVQAGSSFAQLDALTYTLDPSQPFDFISLFETLQEQAAIPQRIVLFWDTSVEHQDGRYEDGLGPYFNRLLYLTQALGRLQPSPQVDISVIANRMRDISGETQVKPDKAVMLGLLSTIPHEYPNVTCRAIDIPSLGAGTLTIHDLATQLVRELRSPATEPIVALRAGQRWVPDFQPVRLAAYDERGVVPDDCLLRHDGVYLITGGLDDVGLLFAREVAHMVRAKLVLLTTRPLPEDGAVGRQLQELEALGCEVMAIHVKALDIQQLDEAFAEAESRFGRIDGLIHAAGMSSSPVVSLIQDLDPNALANDWRDQRQAMGALNHCLRHRALDFCILMSSLASDVGALGQTAHAAACQYQNAVAHRQQGRTPWMVINWDVWQAEDDGAGMNAALAAIAMTPAEGASAFRRILARGALTRMVVSTIDPHLRQETVLSNAHPVRADADPADVTGRHARPDLPNAYEPPRNADESRMAELWQEYLGIDNIGIHDNFFDLGGHSLLATQLVSRIRQMFHVALELDIFFTSPSIAELAEALSNQQVEQQDGDQLALLLDKLDGMSEAEVQAFLESETLPPELLAALTDDTLSGPMTPDDSNEE